MSFLFLSDPMEAFRWDRLVREILGIAVPVVLTLAANPVASKIHMAILGRLDSMELEVVEASNAGYNLALNFVTFALASVTASFVAKEKTLGTTRVRTGSQVQKEYLDLKKYLSKERKHAPSASTALVVAGFLGVLLLLSTIFATEAFLIFMGVKSDSPQLTVAGKCLTLRSIGAPANLLSCAMQGVFIGFMDKTTPLCATVAGELANIALHPMLIFGYHLGVSGAAFAHAISQYLMRLIKQVDLLLLSFKDMYFCEFIKKGKTASLNTY